MISQTDNPLLILEVLERLTGPLHPLEASRWIMAADHGSQQPVTVCLCEGWMTLEADWQRETSRFLAEPERLQSVLEFNSRLEPSCKIGMKPAGNLVLTAEMPIDAESNASSRIESCVGGYKEALKLHHEEIPASGEFAIDTDPEDVDDWLTRLARSCEESGWPYERKEGSLVLPLETTSDYYQAALVPRADGSAHLRVALSVEPSESPACEFASAVLLLRACRAVRGVRATLDRHEEYYPYCFEATWDEIPSPADLNHALAGLSLAAQLCGSEMQALQQESLAKSFLVFQGLSLEEISAAVSTR